VPRGTATNKTALVLILLLGFAAPSRSQSDADLSSEYSVVKSFEVRPGILMTPKYTADGQVWEMSFERQHAPKSGAQLDSIISDKSANDIVDQLVPPSVRGKGSNSSAISTTGFGGTIIYDYENVSVTFFIAADQPRAGTLAVVITWKNRTCRNEASLLPLQQYPR